MPRSKPAKPIRLVVSAQDENTRIEVLNGNLERVTGNNSRLGQSTFDVKPGAYAIRFYIGADFVQQTVVLDAEQTEKYIHLNDQEGPRFATSAPVRHTKTTREFHREPAQSLSLSKPISIGADRTSRSGHLVFFTRDLKEKRKGNPAKGLSLHQLDGSSIAKLWEIGEKDLSRRWSGVHLQLNEGLYLIRQSIELHQYVEQTIYVVQGWQTQVFLLSSGVGNKERDCQADLGSASVLMARPQDGFDPERYDLRWTESALRALRQSRSVPGSIRNEMLWAKFENPMLGIYGALLLLRQEDCPADLLREVFGNLMGLVGPLPDVLAIGWSAILRARKKVGDNFLQELIRQSHHLATPPMLRASWNILLEASVLHPGLIPQGCFSAKVAQQLIASQPWFCWKGDELSSKDSSRDADTLFDNFVQPTLLRTSRIRSISPAPSNKKDLDAALGYLLQILKQFSPDSEFINSDRFTNLERRIIQFIYPLADQQLQELAKNDNTLSSNILAAIEKRPVGALELVKRLQLPFDTVSRAVASLMDKLGNQGGLPALEDSPLEVPI